ncbi:hypothetical protein LH935_18120 [Gordonia polyisoprenivorans]|uniref:hypothetical protein n=1 Tax=Gordonia polyisoprenivorans TaxID=84595 RepID=UPI0022345B70|nr:hypothetical protein [uncultured Gordonia sp.]UZF54646.1 hypothetical protein LH935_18120 [Gordonia polyisoprenivorans]
MQDPETSGDRLVTAAFSTDQLSQPGSLHRLQVQIDSACEDCKTIGCPRCESRGYIAEERTVQFRIPSSVRFGMKIRLAGQGAPDAYRGHGDLYIEVVEAPPFGEARKLFPLSAGLGITPTMMTMWAAEMAHVLLPDERIDYILRTSGISPVHDHCIITSQRVWIAPTPRDPSLTPTPTFHRARTDLIDATELKKTRVVLHTSDGAEHNIPLKNPADRPHMIELLRPPPPEPPANFVPYAADVAPPAARGYTFDTSTPPQPGDRVPPDCVWSQIPYPGPLPRGARSLLRVSRVMSIDPVARPVNQLTWVLGDPTARTEHPDGSFTLQWQKMTPAKGSSYHIVLSFDRYGVCESLNHRWIDT